MKFESIILINDLIRKIDLLSQEIRIQALNSHLVTISGNSKIGFSAVSISLVEFSHEIEKHSTGLRERIYTILNLVTIHYKIRRNYQVVTKTKERSKNWTRGLEPIIRSQEDLLKANQKKIFGELQHLNSLVKVAYKLCKNGHYIALCSKVEVAHLSENSNFFRIITDKVENCVLQIYHSLETIQREIQSNLESINFFL